MISLWHCTQELASELFAEGVLEMSNARVAIKSAKKHKKIQASMTQSAVEQIEETELSAENGTAEFDEEQLPAPAIVALKKSVSTSNKEQQPAGKFENAAEKRRRKKKRKLLEAAQATSSN